MVRIQCGETVDAVSVVSGDPPREFLLWLPGVMGVEDWPFTNELVIGDGVPTRIGNALEVDDDDCADTRMIESEIRT